MSIGKLTKAIVLEKGTYEYSLSLQKKLYPVGPYYDLFKYTYWDCDISLANYSFGLKLKYTRKDIYEMEGIGGIGDIVINFTSPRREWILK